VSVAAAEPEGHFVDRQPIRRLRIIDREVSDNGSRLQLVQQVALGVLESVELMHLEGATDIRLASVRRTERGVEVLLEGAPPAVSWKPLETASIEDCPCLQCTAVRKERIGAPAPDNRPTAAR
jgi:hypothetical protein